MILKDTRVQEKIATFNLSLIINQGENASHLILKLFTCGKLLS